LLDAGILGALAGVQGVHAMVDALWLSQQTYYLGVELCQTRLALAIKDQKCTDHGDLMAWLNI